ncbi:MAG: PaaI family thioesterase [Actinomycetota bacterium]|nr:PaaI family thioesterase [Actinomycetota bacterium]
MDEKVDDGAMNASATEDPVQRLAYHDKLGIEIEEATADRVVATMPVDGNTQPDGILHGGATMSIVESLASLGAALAAGWPENFVAGQQQTCNFISAVSSGRVRAVATPLHKGKTTQVWDVDVTAVETGRRVAAGRVTLAVRPRRGSNEQPSRG